MNRYERLNLLLERVAEHGVVEVEDLARDLGVSTATIRRDLDHMAQQQLLTRTRGGAVAHTVSYDLPLRYKAARHASEKQRIARAAARLVDKGMVVGLNGGTTTTEVARALATMDESGSRSNGQPTITIVTNALNIASELAVRPHVRIVVIGGVVRPQSYELVGPLAIGILDQLTMDIAFLGVDGLDVEHGARAYSEDEAHINHMLASRARRVVVVADASKLGKFAFARISPLAEIDTLVTSSGADEELVQKIREQGVEVILS